MQDQPLPNVDFEAMKDLTRLAWLVNFEAVATVAPKGTALVKVSH